MHDSDSIPTISSRRRTFYSLSAIGLSLAAIAVAIPLVAEAAGPPCPAKAEGDTAFRIENIGECIYVNADHNLTPRLGAVIDYNIYCPGRIPTSGWDFVGKEIALGTEIKDKDGRVMNPIAAPHAAAGLSVNYLGMPHIFHYGCASASKNCVATHIKVRVRSAPLGPPPVPNCTAVKQSGSIALNADMEREYKCLGPMFRSSQRGGWDSMVKTVAADLVRKQDKPTAAKLGGKVCLQPSTDIQCAPCRHSDKLVVRVKTVPKAYTCPKGGKEIL